MDTLTTKKWYQSKTIWAIVIGFVALGAKALGVTDPSLPLSPDDAQAITYVQQVQAAHGSIAAIATTVVSFIAFAFGIYGRITADTAIGSGTTPTAQ